MARHDGWRNSPSRGNPRKKKTSSLIPLIHVDVRENGTESSVKDARVQLTRENWPKETRYAKREPTPDRAAFESREGKRESGERTEKERKTREGVMERRMRREKERDIIRSWKQRWGEVKGRVRKGTIGRRTEREEEKSRRVGVSSLVGTSYSFILKRPRKIANTVETVLFLLHTWIPGYTSGWLRNSFDLVHRVDLIEWKEMILRREDRLRCFFSEFWETDWKRKRFRKRG